MSLEITPLSVDRASLPVADCGACGRRSLTWIDLGGDDEVRRCLGCNAPVDEGMLRLEGTRTLESLGYAFVPTARRPGRTKRKGACGAKGVRGCGSGGCSSGSCGTGGGCGCG